MVYISTSKLPCLRKAPLDQLPKSSELGHIFNIEFDTDLFHHFDDQVAVTLLVVGSRLLSDISGAMVYPLQHSWQPLTFAHTITIFISESGLIQQGHRLIGIVGRLRQYHTWAQPMLSSLTPTVVAPKSSSSTSTAAYRYQTESLGVPANHPSKRMGIADWIIGGIECWVSQIKEQPFGAGARFFVHNNNGVVGKIRSISFRSDPKEYRFHRR